MTQQMLQKKVLDLQAELDVIKQVLKKEPDFAVDEKNWQKVKSEVKKTRKQVYRGLYDKNDRKSISR